MAPSLRRPPLVQAICDRLVSDHRRQDWLPPERQLAADLGVSRPALREAIKRLENQGLLASRHGVGVQVVNQPHAPIQAVFERTLTAPAERIRQFTAARLLIEPELAAQTSTRIQPAEIARLRAIHAQFTNAPDFATAVAADLEFHHQIARLADNRVLELMIASMSPLEVDSRRVTLSRVGRPAANEQHTAILDAIIRHDPEAARTAMQAHLQAADSGLRASQS